MARENIYQALIKRYEAEISDAHTKIMMMVQGANIIPEHIDITGEIDKLLAKVEAA